MLRPPREPTRARHLRPGGSSGRNGAVSDRSTGMVTGARGIRPWPSAPGTPHRPLGRILRPPNALRASCSDHQRGVDGMCLAQPLGGRLKCSRLSAPHTGWRISAPQRADDACAIGLSGPATPQIQTRVHGEPRQALRSPMPSPGMARHLPRRSWPGLRPPLGVTRGVHCLVSHGLRPPTSTLERAGEAPPHPDGAPRRAARGK